MNKLDSLSVAAKAKIALGGDLFPARALGDMGACFDLGAPDVDAVLHGGLPVAALHEIQAERGHYANAAAFALLLALRASGNADVNEDDIFWIGERRQARKQGWLYPPGISEIGVDPDRILYADAPDMQIALRIAADAARLSPLAAIILSVGGARPAGLDLTATRRLSLFARESAVPVILLRDHLSATPSSAWSRWEVQAAPSRPLPANAPGGPVFDVKIARHRGGQEGLSALLEWNRETQSFAAHTRSVPAIPVIREDIAGQRKRA